MRTLAALAILCSAMAAIAAPASAADDYDRLGRLERIEVDRVLAERGREVDRAPAGKTIREVIVVTRPVFGVDEGAVLRWFNVFHATTREAAIRRELLFAGGDGWDQERIDETLRGIRDPLFHNVLVILPLVTDEPGRVDALVVVRDVWSLRLASRYELQGTDIISLQISLTENNLFGWRKRLAMSFVMDQGDWELGPSYVDPNIAGTRLTARASARLIFSRAASELEGSRSSLTVAYPFWSLRQPWAAQLELAHLVGVARSFVGTKLRTYDAPETAAVEMVPRVYDQRQFAAEAQLLRSFGAAVIVRVGGGYELSIDRPRLPAEFPDDDALRAAFTRDVLPPSEVISGPFVRAQLFTPIYAARRDLATFDFREDYQLGPSLEARAGVALDALGADGDFVRLSGAARWSEAWGGGLYRVGVGYAARLTGGELVNRNATAGFFLATPVLARVARVVAALDYDLLEEERQNRYFVLGGSNGLRGYPVNQFLGLARLLGHLELRTRPLHISFLRLGAVAFWDLGDAAASPSALSLKHGVGGGGRLLIPQLDPLVIRFDWAFALNGPNRGFPGRFILGVEQVF